MMKKQYIAVDLGATSGRVILGTLDHGRLLLEELHRFPNKIMRMKGHFFWNLYGLFGEIITGLKEAAAKGAQPQSIGIDTWGVDFALFDRRGNLLGNPLSYRDPHTEGEPERFFSHIPAPEVYAKTGVQVMNINSLFQLSALRRQEWGALEMADKILFTPDALGFLLTGNAVMETTIASTSAIFNPLTGQLDSELLEAVRLTDDRFGKPVSPGTPLGTLTPEAQGETGLGAVEVVSVAGHDTASAVAAVPALSPDFAYLSSGTWSLVGIETTRPIINEHSARENFTNEGGVEGTTRFLKNICGMWLLESCRAEWTAQGQEADYSKLMDAAEKVEPYRSLVFPDSAAFAMPKSMLKAIESYCRQTSQPVPQTQGEFTRCIFDSLSLRYRQVFGLLKEFSDHPLKVLHIIGGGSRNKLLNQLTANAIGVPVVAGPTEGTALGNIMLQAKAAGQVKNLAEMRIIISNNISTATFNPDPSPALPEAYARFLALPQ